MINFPLNHIPMDFQWFVFHFCYLIPRGYMTPFSVSGAHSVVNFERLGPDGVKVSLQGYILVSRFSEVSHLRESFF
jgi:hypothetical protein